MIWVRGETDGGSLGQLCVDREAADRFCELMQSSVANPIRWTLVEVEATEGRAAHEEAERNLSKGIA